MELESTPLRGVRMVLEVTGWIPSMRGQVTATWTARVGYVIALPPSQALLPVPVGSHWAFRITV